MPPNSVLAAPEGLQGVTIVEVVPGEHGRARAAACPSSCGPARCSWSRGTAWSYDGTPDALSYEAAEALARQLAPLRMGSGGDDDEPLLANLDFTDLLSLGDAASVDVSRTWRPRSLAERLRVPIGVGEDGQPVMLDLKEAAQDGMGPHGLCVGATGSGKSELLRTLVLGLAVTHSSETLNFVLADFKGGATFAGMAQMPHVAAVITNLADDLTLVDRMGDSIRGELNRRQEMLRDAGNYANIHDYEKARAAGAPLAPIPSLVLVIDEFSELLTAKPDFIDMFIQIGRIGRSLGVHLLLASQRLEEGRLRGLETYLSYRSVCGPSPRPSRGRRSACPDAYHLPSRARFGLPEVRHGRDDALQGGVRLRASTAPGPARTRLPAGPLPVDRRPVLFTAAPVPVQYVEPAHAGAPCRRSARRSDDALADTVLDVIVRRLEGQGTPAHQVWLPPLDSAPPLDELLPGLAPVEGRGLTQPDYARPGPARRPAGPGRQALRAAARSALPGLLRRGGPHAGRRRSAVGQVDADAHADLRRSRSTHTPHEVQFYGLDFGGGGMSAVAELPHVGGVASRLDPERVRRTVAEVYGILDRREEYFRANGIDSIATYRRRRARGEICRTSRGATSSWSSTAGATSGTTTRAWSGVVTDIAARGLGYGIHLVITASRTWRSGPALKDQLMNRLELRLGDTMDSEFDRKVAGERPAGRAGPRPDPGEAALHGRACRGSTASTRTSDLVRGHGGDVQRGRSGTGRARRPRPYGCCRANCPLRPAARRAATQPERGVAFAHRREQPGAGVRRLRDRPVLPGLRRERVGQDEPAAAARQADHGALRRGRGARSSSATTGARLLGAIPDGAPAGVRADVQRHGDAHGRAGQDLMQRSAPAAGRHPAAAARPQLVDAARRCSSSSTTTTWSSTSSGNPLAVLTENLPFARDVGRALHHRPQRGGCLALDVRALHAAHQGARRAGRGARPATRARATCSATCGRGRCRPGRGFFVSRKRGTPLVQLGWMPEQ